MQKKILLSALALAFGAPVAATAYDFNVGASTNISVSGLVAVGLKNSEVTNTARAVQSETRVDDNTSRLIVAGNTDIGNGMKAIFRIESRYTNDTRPSTPLAPGSSTTVGTGTGWADGDTWGGLSGPFGSVYFGKSVLYYTDTVAVTQLGLKGAGESYRIWDANGLAVYNILGQVGTQGASFTTLGLTRAQNVLRWDSPVVNGLDGSVAWTKNASGDENHFGCAGCTPDYSSGGTWYGRLRYNQGPLSASFSAFNTKVNGGVFTAPYLGPLDKTAWRASVGYTFDAFKVGFVYDNTNVKNGIPGVHGDAKRGAFSLPVSYSFGKNAVYATYSRAGDTSGVNASGAKQFNLAYDYAIAKTAAIGVFYTQFKNDANGSYAPYLTGSALGATAPRTGEGMRQLSVDLNYWF